MSANLTIDVSDKGGSIFAVGATRFETTRKARPEYQVGAVCRVRQTPSAASGFRLLDHGEWVIRSVTRILDMDGVPDGRVVLSLHRLATDWGPRLNRAARVQQSRALI